VSADLTTVSIIVPAFQALGSIGACLRSIREEARREAGRVDLHVIVVDDASTDGTADLVAREHPEARLLRLERNVGADGARNAALPLATGAAVAFIDADCELLPGWARALAAGLSDATPVLMGRVAAPAEVLQRAFAIVDLGEFTGEAPRALSNFATLNVAFRRSVLAGRSFDAPLRISGDRLLSWRLHRKGIPIRFAPDMAVLHRPALGTLDRIAERRRRYASAFLRARRRDPTLPGARLLALGPVAAPIVAALRLAKDLVRLVAARRSLGVSPAALPAYAMVVSAVRMLDGACLFEALMEGRGRGPA